MSAVVTCGVRKCTPRNLYPYDREWVVTVKDGAHIAVKNFEQNEAMARAVAADLKERLS